MPAPARKVDLTDRALKALKPAPGGSRVVIWDAVMPSLAVRVSAKGKKSFYTVKRRLGDTSPSWVLLGVYPVLSLADARKRAREALGALAEGQHPKRLAEAKRLADEKAAAEAAREATATRFETVAADFERLYIDKPKQLRPHSQRTYRRYLRRLVEALGEKPIGNIRRRDIIDLVEAVQQQSGAPTASGLFGVLRCLFGWALDRDVPGLEANPSAGIRITKLIGSPQSRDRLLSDVELAAIWRACPTVGQPFDTVFRLLMLTGARLNEIAAAKWEDLDLDRAELLIPASRSKNKEAQIIPLTSVALELLAAVPRFSGPFIFTTTAGLRPAQHPSNAKAKIDAVLRAQGIEIAPWVVHDLRRAVRSGLGRLGIAPLVAELVIGHKAKAGIVSVYDRHSYAAEKRAALARWQAHLMGIIAPPDGEKVVALPVRVPA